MSVRVLGGVLGHFHPDSEPADRLVLVALADAAHDDGITWIGQESLAATTLLSERTVRRSLGALAAREEIELRKAQRGRRRINVYRVVGAPEDPDYDRLPFTLVEPFTPEGLTSGSFDSSTKGRNPETGADVRSSRSQMSGRPDSTTGQDVRSSEGVPSVPGLTKIDGRNLGWDALADECGIVDDDPRAGEIAVALNTRTGQLGIRALFWGECIRYAEQLVEADPATEEQVAFRLRRFHDDGEQFERALERAIRSKAARYRQAMSGAILTPGALRKWWMSLERMRPASGGLTPEEIERLGSAL